MSALRCTPPGRHVSTMFQSQRALKHHITTERVYTHRRKAVASRLDVQAVRSDEFEDYL
jgi:hypothetical protein